MHPYIGSGPYCYSNSLSMLIGEPAPAIEVLTGSPFGMQLLGGRLPLFDPHGWDPDQGLDIAIDLLGWTCVRQSADTQDQALAQLREAVEAGPVFVGPVEMGLLVHQPGMGTPIEADHFVVVTAVAGEHIQFHDPHGFPYATLPIPAFLAAWRADTISYTEQRYSMRHGFRRVKSVGADAAMRASIPFAAAWLDRGESHAAADRLAEMISDGLDPAVHGHLTHFAIRVGARRLSDAATALTALGLGEAAALADHQAQLVGGLQYELTSGSPARAAATLRELGPTYATLATLLHAEPSLQVSAMLEA